MKNNNIRLVVDKHSVKHIIRMGIHKLVGEEKIIVFSTEKPEEHTLIIYRDIAPSLVYICNEKAELETLIVFIKKTGIDINKC